MKLLHRFDYKLASWVQQLPKQCTALLRLASLLGEPAVVLSIGLAGFFVARNSGNPDTQKVFILAIGAYGLNTALKQLLHRRRPHNLKMTTLGIKSYSFPSGHAFGSIIFYGLLAYCAHLYLTDPWGALTTLVLATLIFFIGISRIYLKTHYPSDVVAGWLLGGLSLYLVLYLTY